MMHESQDLEFCHSVRWLIEIMYTVQLMEETRRMRSENCLPEDGKYLPKWRGGIRKG
jgi:hypothetical protein